MPQKNETIVSFRAPRNLKDMVAEFVKLGFHMSPSDFYRTAARNQIKTDAPDLYHQFFIPKNHEEKASDE